MPLRLPLSPALAAVLAASLLTTSARGGAPQKSLTAARAERAARRPSSEATVVHMNGEVSTYTDTDHINVVTPSASASVESPTEGWSASGSYLVDVISAASVDIVSTASMTWHEVRQAGTLSGTYKPHDFGVTVAGAMSSEPDYLSLNGGATFELDLDQKDLTPLFGYSYGHDTAGRTGTPFSVYSLTLQRHSFDAALDAVINRSTLLVLIGDAILESGDQSKPYRYIPMFAPSVASNVPVGASIDQVNALRLPERPLEQLPLSRQRYSLTARLVHRLRAATLRASARLYADSWGLKASTVDGRLLFDVTRRLFVGPHLRFHAQTPVTFWRRAYVATFGASGAEVPAYRTGDRELGPLEAGTLGATAWWFLGHAELRSALNLRLSLEATQTYFLNDLYIKSRLSGFAAISVGSSFE